MQRVYSEQLAEVQKYLGNANRRRLYEDFQDVVKREILRNLDTPRHFSLVSEIFSRSDRSPEAPIKTDQKIALKLYKWSRGLEKKDRPKAAEIHDIGGVTVVCNYPSDTDQVAELFRSSFDSSYFSFTKVDFRDPARTNGYRAYHAVASGLGNYNGITCEVQIKTSLTMSWGAKTHDLTYKPMGEIDKRLNLYMEKLSNVALILDEQSEILKSLIFDAWEMDEERRNTARRQLISGIATSEDPGAAEIANFVSDNSVELSVSSLSDPLHDEALEKIRDCCSDPGPSKDLCRVVVLYALCRKFGDRNDWAIEIIDDWYERIEGDEGEEYGVLAFRSVACMALGEYEEAIETGREIVRRAENLGEKERLVIAKANLAYFLSEAYFHRAFDESSGGGERITKGSDDCRDEALDIAQKLDIDKIADIAKKFRTLDTKGGVMITCSESENDIRAGLDICEDARKQSIGSDWEEAAKSFFSLHEKRAFRRLLSFK